MAMTGEITGFHCSVRSRIKKYNICYLIRFKFSILSLSLLSPAGPSETCVCVCVWSQSPVAKSLLSSCFCQLLSFSFFQPDGVKEPDALAVLAGSGAVGLSLFNNVQTLKQDLCVRKHCAFSSIGNRNQSTTNV